jgi:hypothetical protein
MRGAGVLHAPIVLACSRAAWALGVRLGMTATAARSLSREGQPLQLVTAEAAIERETVRSLADALLGVSPVVDVGGRVGAGGAHLAMYAEVPAKTRGATFGDRLLEVLDELGMSARIGIADDRFTAWVAAAYGGAEDRGVVSVPRGGSAAYLSPRSLSLLAIPAEVQHMLEALGVRTLGEFAALPAPSIARPLEADYQALARGESGAALRPYAPEAPIREDIVIRAGGSPDIDPGNPAIANAGVLQLGGSVGATAPIALLAKHLALRLAGRRRLAARVDVTLWRDGEAVEVPVSLDHPIGPGSIDATDNAHVQTMQGAEEVARALGPVLDEIARQPARSGDTYRLRVLVAAEALPGASSDEIIDIAERRLDGTIAAVTSVAVGSAPIASPSTRSTRSSGEAGSFPARAPSGADARSASEVSATMSPLAVVLSSTGSLFALTPPVAPNERRETHRRTRRGKQRRTRPQSSSSARASVQPRLFDRGSSK